MLRDAIASVAMGLFLVLIVFGVLVLAHLAGMS